MIAAKSLKEFVRTAKTVDLSYNHDAKERWHRLARNVAKALAAKLGLSKGEYSIRYNRGGIAVSGETMLHADWLYLDLSVSCMGPRMGVMYRSCKGQKDYTGGVNQWMQFDELLDLDKAAAKLAECRGAA
jgi:hypothetical protein